MPCSSARCDVPRFNLTQCLHKIKVMPEEDWGQVLKYKVLSHKSKTMPLQKELKSPLTKLIIQGLTPMPPYNFA
jgi:hypothetical protein